MGGTKRQLEDGIDGTSSHKRRKDFSQHDVILAQIYNDLAEEVEEVRLQAASKLIKHITADAADLDSAVDKALTRLIKGVSSSRKAARLGFSVALAEVLRIALLGSQTLEQILTIITKLISCDGHASGQERRDAWLGLQFAYQAILQIGSETIAKTSLADWAEFQNAVAALASQRQWLRKQCGHMLYDFIDNADVKNLDSDRLQALINAWSSNALWKTPEGVALWLALSTKEGLTLPKHVWHHRSPLAGNERAILSKVMQEVPVDDEVTQPGSGTRRVTPSFAWIVVLKSLQLLRDNRNSFVQFWESAVSHGLFSTTSSIEKKALGLQVAILAIRVAHSEFLETVLSPEIVRCVVNQRSNAEGYLSESARALLNAIIARSKLNPNSTVKLLGPLVRYGPLNFDHMTKTKTVETLIAQKDDVALEGLQDLAIQLILKCKSQETGPAETQRRIMADYLISALRIRREESDLFKKKKSGYQLKHWLQIFMGTLLSVGYGTELDRSYNPPVTEATRSVFKERLMACLGHLLSFRIELAALGPSYVLSRLRNVRKSQHPTMKRAAEVLESISKRAVQPADNDLTSSHALQLLLSMTMLLAYGDEPDSISALNDLLMSIESWNSSEESKTIFVEIIISFLSKPSTIYKKLAEQVFNAFAPSMTSDSLRSMLDILEQKESATGQQELFDQNGDAHNEQEDEEEADEEAIDVEDDSDVEIVNGLVAGEEDSDDSDSDKTSDTEENGNEDEEAEFDRKLAAALGTAGADEDEDDDGSDMDDEQMIALEPHLATIFKERQKQSTAKQDNKDARENIINFKNRILDLLAIYVKTQYSSANAIELIYPLIVLIRTTTSKPTAEKAFTVLKQYFDAYNKNKPEPSALDHKILFALLAVIHTEVAEGGSKLHTSACSRSSLFISKVLVSMDPSHYSSIAEKYAKLQSEWYLNPKSKVQSSMFTEFTSWSITTRKH